MIIFDELLIIYSKIIKNFKKINSMKFFYLKPYHTPKIPQAVFPHSYPHPFPTFSPPQKAQSWTLGSLGFLTFWAF
mgnify:CR=1 FL=1